MNYTALGASVNLAARLEALNKEYGTTMLVSEAVKARVADEFSFEASTASAPRFLPRKRSAIYRVSLKAFWHLRHGRLVAALQIGQGAPALPQLQARSPSHGRSGSCSQPNGSYRIARTTSSGPRADAGPKEEMPGTTLSTAALFVFLPALHELWSCGLVMAAAAAKEHQRH